MSKLRYSEKGKQLLQNRRRIANAVKDDTTRSRAELSRLATEFIAAKLKGGITKQEAKQQRDKLKQQHKAEHAMRLEKAALQKRQEQALRKAKELANQKDQTVRQQLRKKAEA